MLHGREGEDRKRRWHMWRVPVFGTTVTAADSTKTAVTNFFYKDGRKISVGDCALFKSPQDTSPPFIGIIRWLASSKEDYLKLGVNWLYRPADVKLGKGIFLEAAPNEVFYSFHKDEILAASVLHPCKVAFLRKGVELPSGISAFVCRRVYDTTNKCLWWLTDQDYINERQEEVNQLLDKTRKEMHAAVQSGGRSPKPLSGPTSMQQLKPGSDSAHNSPTSFSSQVKGKKRERGDQVSEPIKRERSLKRDDGDLSNCRLETVIKSEIAKIKDYLGGLANFQGVEGLVQLMQPDRTEKKIDLACRMMLLDVISATEHPECLEQFMQLRGIAILDEWLQEVHKGKVGDSSSPKESDKSVEEFLFALLRALNKLPVNLHALQTCNVGKSVNNLRSHKNFEIQKKARSLVDTWKKRVEAEMRRNDAKSRSSQTVSWPTKQDPPEISHAGNKRTGVSSEGPINNSITQPSVYKTTPVKLSHGDGTPKPTAASPGSVKLSASFPASVAMSSKESHCKPAVSTGASDMPRTTMKEEKSSSSGQSQNNSQSCSSDQAKNVGSAWKEDARSSTAGSMNVNKTSTGASRHRKPSNGVLGSAVSGVQKETSFPKSGLLNRSDTSEKVLQSGFTCERTHDIAAVDHGNSQRLIVRLPNPGRSPAQSATGALFDDPSITTSRGSSPGVSEKHDQYDRKLKGRTDSSCRRSNTTEINPESWQSNDVKNGFSGSDEGVGSPVPVLDEERCRTGEASGKPMETAKATCSSSRNDKGVISSESKPGKLHDASVSSINALIESCVKYSEASARVPVGDDIGMNLLASVAAGEMGKSDQGSPLSSPGRNSALQEDSSTGNETKSRFSREDVSGRCDGKSENRAGGDLVKQGNVDGPSPVNNGLHHTSNISDSKHNSSFIGKKTTGRCSEKSKATSLSSQQNTDPSLKSDGKPDEITTAVSVVVSSVEIAEEGAVSEVVNGFHDKRNPGVTDLKNDGSEDLRSKVETPFSDENKVDHGDEVLVSNKTMVSDSVHGSVSDQCETDIVGSSTKNEKGAVEESKSCPLLDMNNEKKHNVHERLIGGTSMDPGAVNGTRAIKECADNVMNQSGPGNVLNRERSVEHKGEKVDDVEVRTHDDHMEDKKMKQLIDVIQDGQVGTNVSDHTNGGMRDKSENQEVLEQRSCRSALNVESPTIPVEDAEHCVKSVGSKTSGVEGDGSDECASTAEASSLSVTPGLDFDLNEGFPLDEGNQSEPVTLAGPEYPPAAHLPSTQQFPLPSISSGLPASITVAAAAKGPFVPPENLLKSTGELGWKGSAATSAFRPAEPRRVLEMPLSTTDVPPDTNAGRKGRPALDIDLNVADERVLDDMTQISGRDISCESGLINYRALGHNAMLGSAPVSVGSAGGLDLDLNRVDEGNDAIQFSANTIRRLEVPLMPVGPSLSGGFPNGEVNVLRDFDLNNGPGFDEVGTEQLLHGQHAKNSVPFLSPVTGPRMSSTELGSISWFPHGNSYPAVAIPSILPDRGEQPYPGAGSASIQRMLGPPTGGLTFGPDVFRGPVLSSSPAVAFSPATPFPYPGFPFGASYPLPSTSFSGGSTSYMDSSSGGGLCFPSVPSQLVGPAGSVSSQYPRPYVISLPDGSTNTGAESSRNWRRQGLDLNAGPGVTDLEGRDERLPSSSRQLSIASSHTLAEEHARMYQAAGGLLKRKEPEGGWDAERFSYKQPSWQ